MCETLHSLGAKTRDSSASFRLLIIVIAFLSSSMNLSSDPFFFNAIHKSFIDAHLIITR